MREEGCSPLQSLGWNRNRGWRVKTLDQAVFRKSPRHNIDRPNLSVYWTIPPGKLLSELDSSPNDSAKWIAERRLQAYGPNALRPGAKSPPLRLLLNQFQEPLVPFLSLRRLSLASPGMARCRDRAAVVLGSTTWGSSRNTGQVMPSRSSVPTDDQVQRAARRATLHRFFPNRSCPGTLSYFPRGV